MCIRDSSQTDQGKLVGELIATLQGSGDVGGKARACQKLTVLGAKEAVPALSALLADQKLGAYARSALEVIADPSAAQALRRAAGSLTGGALIGVVNSIGMRRDSQATPMLARMASGRDTAAAAAALAALGRIATPEAASALRRALTSPSAATRAAAADGLLASAERLLAAGNRAGAARLYEAVRRAELPGRLRSAGLRGMIVAGLSAQAADQAALRMLAGALRSSSLEDVRVALHAVRYLPGAAVTRVLATELRRARPDVMMLIAGALMERRDPDAFNAIEALVASESAGVRLAALGALGGSRRASSVVTLLRALEAATDEAEAAAAATSLTQTTAPGADEAIVARLGQARPASTARLLGVLGQRGPAIAADAVLKLAADPDTAVRKAALSALTTLARPRDLPELVRLASGASEDAEAEVATQAVRAAWGKLPDPGSRSAPMVSGLSAASDIGAKRSLIRMLGQVGGLAALKAVKGALADREPAVREAAVASLCAWPDASAVPALLAVLKGSSEPAMRARALRGVISLAGALAADMPRPSRQLIGWLSEANRTVGNDAGERRLVLSALANLRCPESLDMIRAYAADPNVKEEAQLALDRVTQQMPAAVDAASPKFAPIFDGRTFEGWEGDTASAFRIEDGAIVGGSMTAPVPRNEFLCTVRPYGDFILRLECRLKSANGGIQLRSQRVPASSEVSGYQADMDSGGTYWGCLYDESRRGMLVQADQAKVLPHVKKDDWNSYEIRCEGPRIRLFVNGAQTVDYTELDEDILMSGVIAVQVHGGPPSETWYRKIEIAELP